MVNTAVVSVSYKDVPQTAVAADENDDDDYNDDDDDDDYDDDDFGNDACEHEIHNTALTEVDEAPEDLDAFFVHPLTAASRATADGDALALLHEYRNLPVLDVHLSSATNRYTLSLLSTSKY